jgi:hypothetical protein
MKASSPRYPTFVIYEGYDRALALASVGKGWAPLIHEVFDLIEQKKITQKVVQVKEKFGGLRIYTDIINDELEKKVIEVGNRSFTICEECGAPGQLRGGSWYRTLCDVHGKNKPAVKDE